MSYYHGLISSRKANAVLSKIDEDGCFLVRDSQSQPGNFVLSIRFGGNVYHVLVFHENGQYFLDSSSDSGENEYFASLDELVIFGMAHELKIAGKEVQLHHPIPCEGSVHAKLLGPLRSQHNRSGESDDCDDDMTDLFAAVLGMQCSVLVVAHSNIMFDGRSLPDGEEWICCLVKDSLYKAFFIRIIDPKARELVGEKRITKQFEYDCPADLTLTFLSEHGITCLGFRTAAEGEMFVKHLDRIIQLQQDRAMKLRGRMDSVPLSNLSPVHMKTQLKAEDFDIYNLSPEWQYLFDQAGVTRAMIEDKQTLQFILNTLFEMGGAPQKLQQPPEEVESNNRMAEERSAALAMDSVLRHESLRASRLADELRKRSLQEQQTPQAIPRKLKPPTCLYSGVCIRYKDKLMERSSLTALAPNQLRCYCVECGAGKPVTAVSGSPPHQYTLPMGWCQFILRSQTHSLAQQFCSRWHVGFCYMPASRVAGVVRTGQLLHAASDGKAILSPDLPWSRQLTGITPESFYDEIERCEFRVSTAFQVFVQPESYIVDRRSNVTMAANHLHEIWLVAEKTYIPYALLVHLQPKVK